MAKTTVWEYYHSLEKMASWGNTGKKVGKDKENLREVELIQAQLEVNTARYWLMLLGLRSTAGMVVLELILLGLVNTAKLS
ncbi:hypothetical protein Tco_1580206 [Tanacetum coccineum]